MIRPTFSSSTLLALTLQLACLLPADAAASTQPQPYTINVDPQFIEQTRAKASTFRNSIDTNAPAWFDGPPASQIGEIAKYWADEYDWSAVQDEINANFSHFYTTVPPTGHYTESVDLHFIHQRSEREDAIPILLLHGWPSTALEWEKIIPSLVKPDNDSQPAFHVVAPDFPGFGFSPDFSGSRVGIDRTDYATIFASLMEQLGYDEYVLYSTDLGFVVALSLIVDYQDRIINHVTDFYLAMPDDADQARLLSNQTTPEETAYLASINAFFTSHSAYAEIHSTYPQSLAYALNDSPVGFLAWRYQLAQTVSDKPYTNDQLITDTLLLYINGVYPNIRSYKELYGPANFAPTKNFTVPTSVLQFGGVGFYTELANFNYVPRSWVERTANVTYFARHDAGGHFPALSEPELVVGDLRAIFSS